MKVLRYCLYTLPIGILFLIVSLAVTDTDWGQANAVFLTYMLFVGAFLFAVPFAIIGFILRYRFDQRVYILIHDKDYSQNVVARNLSIFLVKVFPPKEKTKK